MRHFSVIEQVRMRHRFAARRVVEKEIFSDIFRETAARGLSGV
jgi:hypothetical protein